MIKNSTIKVVFSFFLIGLCSKASAGLVQWNSGVGSNNHWYQSFVTANGISWEDAQAAATARGGYLVTIRSQEENDFIANNSLIMNPETANGSLQGSFWTGGVADIMDENSLTQEVATTWHWANGESWDYSNFSGADADGLDAKATGNVITDNVTFPIPTYLPETTVELASYLRIGKYPDNNGGWSDQPDNGHLISMEVDFITGDILTPLHSINFMYGYVIEFENRPENIPEPTTLAIFALGLLGLSLRKRKIN